MSETQPVKTVTQPHVPQENLFKVLNEALQALSIYQEYEAGGMRLAGICAVRDYFRRQK